MLYIQLNKKDAILNMLERLRFSRSIYLNGATIDRVGNIPVKIKNIMTTMDIIYI